MLQMRLMDYFITSHPIAVFVLTAVIAIDEIKKLKEASNKLDQAQFFIHFQQLDKDKIDYDKYIKKCAQKIKEIDFNSLIQCYKERKYMDYYPIMKKVPFGEDLLTYETHCHKQSLFSLKTLITLCISLGTVYIAILYMKARFINK